MKLSTFVRRINADYKRECARKKKAKNRGSTFLCICAHSVMRACGAKIGYNSRNPLMEHYYSLYEMCEEFITKEIKCSYTVCSYLTEVLQRTPTGKEEHECRLNILKDMIDWAQAQETSN
jgi:hypothetical protein